MDTPVFTASLPMEEPPQEEQQFYYADKYLYESYWYFGTFPIEWAKTHIEGTGPVECDTCVTQGSILDGTVFLGYCIRCAQTVYDGTRGRGFQAPGIESAEHASVPSAFDTYLEGVDPFSIEPVPPEPAADHEDQDQDQDQDDYQGSILECHFEGGYNDF